jgi:hypothetical protein
MEANGLPRGDPIFLTKGEYDKKSLESFTDYGAEESAALQRYSIILGSAFIGLGLLRYFSKK